MESFSSRCDFSRPTRSRANPQVPTARLGTAWLNVPRFRSGYDWWRSLARFRTSNSLRYDPDRSAVHPSTVERLTCSLGDSRLAVAMGVPRGRHRRPGRGVHRTLEVQVQDRM